jgi:hypothetical protein
MVAERAVEEKCGCRDSVKNDRGRGNNRLGSVFDITGTFA